MNSQSALYTDLGKIVGKLESLLENDNLLGLAFDDCREDRQQKVFKVDKEKAPDPEKDDVWFFGDIHGDLFGMIAAIKYARKTSEQEGKNPLFVFLGDFTDRGPLDYLVLLKLYSMILDERQRGRICVIAGNHDECLQYNEKKEEFYATVYPAEFTDWLNAREKGSEWQRLGAVTINFFERMPRAIFLPDGLFFAHAGVPHPDLHEAISNPEQMNTDECLEHFVWARAAERKPKVRRNYSSKGGSFGYKDFYKFCNRASEVLGQPVNRMLRGHDHYLDGYKHYKKYEDKQILTLNTRCWQPDTPGGPCAPNLCVARWVKGAMPEVKKIKVPEGQMKRVYDFSLDEE